MKKQNLVFAKAQYQTPGIAAFDVEVERVIASSLEPVTEKDGFIFVEGE